VPSLSIIYASTSGHTEFVVDTLIAFLQEKGIKKIDKTKAERATVESLTQGDVLLLASSTWNTGNTEGQLNPHMHALLRERAKDIDLKGKKVALIGLGDQRYFYTCKAAKHLEEFTFTHKGTLVVPTLKILNEPYGQEEDIKKWGELLVKALNKEGSRASEIGHGKKESKIPKS
jgi:flavodoxin